MPRISIMGGRCKIMRIIRNPNLFDWIVRVGETVGPSVKVGPKDIPHVGSFESISHYSRLQDVQVRIVEDLSKSDESFRGLAEKKGGVSVRFEGMNKVKIGGPLGLKAGLDHFNWWITRSRGKSISMRIGAGASKSNDLSRNIASGPAACSIDLDQARTSVPSLDKR
ncbi:hypothetical protein V6N13_029789 [Hibiscus sabdariffa]